MTSNPERQHCPASASRRVLCSGDMSLQDGSSVSEAQQNGATLPNRSASRCSALDKLPYAAAPIRLNFAIKRDFRRAALFLWMTPLLATRSSMLTALTTAVAAASASPSRIASSAFLTKVRAADRKGRFRSRRRSATRIRFSADLLFAKTAYLSLSCRVLRHTLDTPTSGVVSPTPQSYQSQPAGSTLVVV